MFASDQSVAERTAVGWQICVDGPENHDTSARRFVLEDVTQRPTGLEEGAVVVDIIDVDMHLKFKKKIIIFTIIIIINYY